MLKGKKILLGITGGIAAYKAAFLARLLVEKGATVKTVMTPYATEFITPLTLSTLTNNATSVAFFNKETSEWDSHVELGLWADLMLIAPATANSIGKMANGLADNLLLTAYLSAKCPVFVAPAMDLDMYAHASVHKNLKQLREYGNYILEPEEGKLASGLVGKGRLMEPARIVEELEQFFGKKKRLAGKKVLLTTGPTHEKIDPVRFIGNYSSGKMGFELAEAFAEEGAEVTLITGPVSLVLKNPQIKRIDVVSAAEMYQAAQENFQAQDIGVMVAAVSDFAPCKTAVEKIKRKSEELNLTLKATKDIAAELGKQKTNKQLLVGFALETTNEEENARGKLEKKNLDMIVLNSLRDKGAGFQADTNKVTIIRKDGISKAYELKSKADVALDIVENVIDLLKK